MRSDGYCTVGADREYSLTEDALLRAMDAARVDCAVIAPVDRCIAVANAEGNDAMLRAARHHADRLLPACSVNPWFGDAAVTELRRALDAGARMLVLHPTLQGFDPCDDLAEPVLACAIARRTPVYVHTGGYHFGSPAQLALAAMRWPNARFVMGHCGSTDFKNDAVETLRTCPNVFGEVSMVRGFGLRALLEAAGGTRLIMGSAAPVNDLVFEWRTAERALDPSAHPAFYGDTLRALLREGAP